MNLYDSLQEQMNNVHIYSTYFMADCPFHNWESHNQPMMVHDDGFKCLSCGKSGALQYLAGTIKLRGYKVHVTRSQSVVLPRWRRWEHDYGNLSGIAAEGHLSIIRHKEYKWYFKRRQIDQFFNKGYFGYIDGWCLFPVIDQRNDIVDIVVRASKGKGDTRYVVSPAKEHPLYVPDWERVLQAETVYVVYGIIDSWALYSIGLPVVTGTSGKSLSASQLKPLDKRFIIVPDQYEEHDAYKLAGELGWRADVKRLVYPEGTKDPDEIRMRYGEEALRGII